MTVLRFRHSELNGDLDVFAYPGTASWIRDNIPLGHTFELETIEDRTKKEHRWFFAIVKKVWDNLPEYVDEIKSPDHLRKRALIEAGWCETMTMMSSVSAHVAKTVAEWCGEYVHIQHVTGNRGTKEHYSHFVAYRAKSMRFKKNGGELTKAKYREVVERALVWMSGLIGVDAAELLREVPPEFQ